MKSLHRFACAVAVLCGILLFPRPVSAYTFDDNLWLSASGTPQINMYSANYKEPWDSWGSWYCLEYYEYEGCRASVAVFEKPYVQAQVTNPSAQVAFSSYDVHDSAAVLNWYQDSPSNGTWTETSQYYIQYDHYYSDEGGTFLACISFSYMAAVSSSVNVSGAACDPTVQAIIDEYPQIGVTRPPGVPYQPACADFSSTGGSSWWPHITWQRLNDNWTGGGSQHPPWGLIRPSLLSGIEFTQLIYEDIHLQGNIYVESGYRCPVGNRQVYQAAGLTGWQSSPHQRGVAVDLYDEALRNIWKNGGANWTLAQFNTLRDAANAAGAIQVLPYEQYNDHHLHAQYSTE